MAATTGFGRRSSPAARRSGSNPVGDAYPLARGPTTARIGRRSLPAALVLWIESVGDAYPLARGPATARIGRRSLPAALVLWIEYRWGRLSAGANTVGDAIAPGLAARSSSSARSLPEVAAQDAPHREILVELWPVEAEGREFDPFEFRLRHAFETRIPDYGKRQLKAAGQYHANLPVSMRGGNRAIAVRSGGHAAAPTQFHQALSEYARTSNSKVQVDRCCRTRWR